LKQRTNNDVRKVSLQVVSDDIIHVRAVSDKNFSNRQSLIATCTQTKTTDWQLIEDNDNLILQTATTKAIVSLTTGEIMFTDSEGNSILTESHGGGKSFVPVNIDGEKAYSIRQVFESPDDEAFYGLGQHQSDEFNYKGKNEVLFQYNTKVSVPFVVSSRNYGILWDNYSLSRFGDPREYEQISRFTLYGKDGQQGGLTATYENAGAQQLIERPETTIDYENLETVKNFPQDFRFYNSTVTWEGFIEPNESGVFRFILYYAGYTKVYLDDELLVAERWRTAWNPNSYKFAAELASGKKHKLKVEWKPDGGVSYIGLKALSPRPDSEQGKLSLWSEMGDQIDYFFIRGTNMDEVISGYRTITGKAQVMPKWAMGFWQSRERYKTQAELETTLKEFRQRKIPVDNIVQDWSYWSIDAWGSHEFDAARFPDPEGMVKTVHDLDARIMISVWPKFYHTTAFYKDYDAKGWMYRLAVKDSIRDWIGRGYIGSFYDAFSEGARQMFWEQMNEKLYVKGFDAWWMDASEPDILSNASIEYRKALMSPTALGSSTRYFNAYGLMNAKGIYEGQRSTNNEQRVFLLTRSGFAGSQKYAAAIWSGDIGTRWEDMKAQISAGLNYSVSGNPYWTMDNGGFCVENRYERAREGSRDLEEWRELNARWHQFGAFVPLFRSHGQYPFREMWNVAPDSHPAYKTMLYYNELRYRLMPYIYSLAGMAHFSDYTIMRPLVMNFTSDKNTYNIGDQYMFGCGLMVCPVYRYEAREREVYFPAGTNWYDVYSGRFIQGGVTATVDAPYNRIPLYAPEGAIIPMGDVIQHTNQLQSNITLFVYTGKDGAFTLYDDEHTNYNYEKGAFANINIMYDEKDKTLTIGDRAGQYDGMADELKFEVIFVSREKPVGIDEKVTGKEVKYNGKQVTVSN
jgi:alpha-D-xyloside xylohydrolase